MNDMPRPRPPHLHTERTRHGKRVWYVRVGKGRRIRIRAEYGTASFTAAYNAAITGKAADAETPFNTRSLGWLIDRYRESADWAKLSLATRRQRQGILRSVTETAGREPFTRIDKMTIERGTERRAAKPHAQRHFLQTMRGLFQWAVKAKHADNDPTSAIRTIRPSTEGHTPWPDDWCEKYERRWPLGTRERVAYEVVLNTGLRRGDAARLGSPHVKNGVATLRTEKHAQDKLGEIVTIVITPSLQAALDAGPIGEFTFICSKKGQPMKKESFGNWFGEVCRATGIPGTAHGLRKTRATRAANSGATEAELEAMFGWARGSKEAAEYTRKADRVRLALRGAEKLEGEQQRQNIYSLTSHQGEGHKAKNNVKTTPKNLDGGPGRTRTSNQAVMSR
jgi:integrase